MMLTIRLPKDIESRLNRLAKKTGRTKIFFARRAIVEYLGDFEDYYLAKSRARAAREAISLDEVERILGLEN